jgi:hypothetical protein
MFRFYLVHPPFMLSCPPPSSFEGSSNSLLLSLSRGFSLVSYIIFGWEHRFLWWHDALVGFLDVPVELLDHFELEFPNHHLLLEILLERKFGQARFHLLFLCSS